MSQINVKYINLPIPSFKKRFKSKRKLAKMSSSRATVGGRSKGGTEIVHNFVSTAIAARVYYWIKIYQSSPILNHLTSLTSICFGQGVWDER